jgi:hypothetical protein
VRLVLEDKVTWTEIATVMSLDDVVNFTRLYDPWFALVNKPART